MLREDGFVMDDGTVARLGPDRFVMTTTTANAVRVMQPHGILRATCCGPSSTCRCVSVTEQWAQIAVAGPRSRDVLARLVDAPFDIADAAFPFMAARRTDRLRRHAAPGCSASPSPANWPTSSRCRRATATRWRGG